MEHYTLLLMMEDYTGSVKNNKLFEIIRVDSITELYIDITKAFERRLLLYYKVKFFNRLQMIIYCADADFSSVSFLQLTVTASSGAG